LPLRGGNNHEIFRVHAAVDWLARDLDAPFDVGYSPWLISSLPVPFALSSEAPNSILDAPHIPPSRRGIIAIATHQSSEPPATFGLQTGIAYARGSAFTMVRMLMAKL
jgi:hypothetical protein